MLKLIDRSAPAILGSLPRGNGSGNGEMIGTKILDAALFMMGSTCQVMNNWNRTRSVLKELCISLDSKLIILGGGVFASVKAHDILVDAACEDFGKHQPNSHFCS